MRFVKRVRLIVAAIVAAVLAAGFLGSALMRRARSGSKSFSGPGWALLFLFSGRMPPPPPETQIELERQTEKDREASRDVRS